MTQQAAIADWFSVHAAYHKASDAYNARLAFVRAERERDPACLVMTCDQEYKTLNEALRATYDADATLYRILKELNDGPST